MPNSEISIEEYKQLLKKLDTHKKIEEELRRTKNILAEAQRIAHIGNWVWDIVNNTLEWSDEIYCIFGLKPQEFGATYEAFLNSVHPDDREFVKNAVNEALYNNQPYSIDHRIVLPDGSIRVVHEQAEVTFDTSGSPTRMLGTVQDVTERAVAEEAKMIEEKRIKSSLVLSRMKDITEAEIVEYALEESVKLTNSKIGYLHFVNEDQKTISLYSWSKDVLKICSAEKEPHYPIANAGVWVECVPTRQPAIHNNYQNLPNKKGYPEGHVHVIRHMSVPIFDEDKIVAVIGVGNKVDPYNQTDARQLSLFISHMWELLKRKRTELELKEERDKAQNYLDTAAVMLVVLNRDQEIILINKRGCEILEAQEEDIIGQNWFDTFIPEERRDEVKVVFNELINGIIEPIEYYENPIITKKGKEKQISWHNTVLRDEKGQIIAILSSGEDITARKLAEEKLKKYHTQLEELVLVRTKKLENLNTQLLQEIKDRSKAQKAIKKSEEKFRALFNSANDIICIHDLEGKLLEVNQVAFERLGYKKDQLLQMRIMEIERSKYAETTSKRIEELIQSGQNIFRTDYVKSNGNIIPVEINARLIDYVGQKAVLSIARDITERINFENLRKQFIYTVSHELRTPISVINQAITNLLKYKEKLTKENQNKLMESLSRNATLLTEIIEDLLLVSRLESEKIQLNWVKYDLLEILNDIIKQLEPYSKNKKITVRCDMTESIQLLGDPMRIAQICRIFIDNAIKYSNENTKIEIKAIDHYKGKYNPKVKDGVLLQIIDEGRGIREQDLPNIFERFFRSEEVLAIPGTGIGLSIARNLAQLHKGTIYVESTYGKGSTFFVFLPRLPLNPN